MDRLEAQKREAIVAAERRAFSALCDLSCRWMERTAARIPQEERYHKFKREKELKELGYALEEAKARARKSEIDIEVANSTEERQTEFKVSFAKRIQTKRELEEAAKEEQRRNEEKIAALVEQRDQKRQKMGSKLMNSLEECIARERARQKPLPPPQREFLSPQPRRPNRLPSLKELASSTSSPTRMQQSKVARSLDEFELRAVHDRELCEFRWNSQLAATKFQRLAQKQKKEEEEKKLTSSLEMIAARKSEKEDVERKKAALALSAMLNPLRAHVKAPPLNTIADRGHNIGVSLYEQQCERRSAIEETVLFFSSQLEFLENQRALKIEQFQSSQRWDNVEGGHRRGIRMPDGEGHIPANHAAQISMFTNSPERGRQRFSQVPSGELISAVLSRCKAPTSAMHLMKEAIANEAITQLDFSGVQLKLQDLFYLREVLAACTWVTTISVEGHSFDFTESNVLVDILLKQQTLTKINVASASFDPEELSSTLLEIANENRAISLHAKGLRIGKEKLGALRAVERREAALLPFVRKLAHSAFEMLGLFIEEGEKTVRRIAAFHEQEQRDRIRVPFLLGCQSITDKENEKAKWRDAFIAVDQAEDTQRTTLESLEGREMVIIRLEFHKQRRMLVLAVRTHEKRLEKEREEHEKAEREVRTEIRRYEHDLRLQTVELCKQELAAIYKLLEERRKAEAEEKERVRRAAEEKRQEEIRAAKEKERIAQRIEAMRKEHQNQREALERSETTQRSKTVEAQERAGHAALAAKNTELKHQLKLWNSYKQRISDRSEVCGLPLQLSWRRFESEQNFVLGSMVPCTLVGPDALLEVEFVKPRFFTNPSPKHDHSTRFQNEVSDLDWARQKMLFLGATITVSLLNASNLEGGYVIVSYDNICHKVDSESGVIETYSGELIGRVQMEAPSQSLTVLVSQSNGWNAFHEAVRSVGVMVDPTVESAASTYSGMSVEVCIAIQIDTCQPTEQEGFDPTDGKQLTVVHSSILSKSKINFLPPIFTLDSADCALVYREGQGDGVLLPGLQSVTPPTSSKYCGGAVVSLDMGPSEDSHDYIWSSLRSTLRLMPSNSSVFLGNVSVGSLPAAGLFGTASTSRELHDPTLSQIAFGDTTTAAMIRAVLTSLAYRNDSTQISITKKKIRLTLKFVQAELVCSSTIVIPISIIPPDQPTTINYGSEIIPFRLGSPVTSIQIVKLLPFPLCYFAEKCVVEDVDTTDFTGGFLSVHVVGETSTDFLSLNPKPSSSLAIHGTDVVFEQRRVGAKVQKSSSWVFIDFEKSSIDAVREIIHSLCYRSTESYTGKRKTIERIVETVLVIEDTSVRSLATIGITPPLFTVVDGTHTLLYREGTGPQHLASFEILGEKDREWRNGFIVIEIVSGYTNDDFISLLQDETIAIDEKSEIGSTLSRASKATSVKSNSKASPSKLTSLKKSPSALEEPKSLLRVNGIPAGFVQQERQGSYRISFNLPPDFQNALPVTQTVVDTIMKHVVFENTSAKPKQLQKVVRITMGDGQPHASLDAIRIEVQTSDQITELQRMSTDPRVFRSASAEDAAGFCPFDDVTLFDPDTFAFNGGIIAVDLVGGGDPQGDQLGFLSAEQQKIREPSLEPIVLMDGNELQIGGHTIGFLTLDAPTPEGHSNFKVALSPLPTGIVGPQSHEEALQVPGVVSIALAQRILQLVTYTNTSAKIRAGVRVYQLRVGFEEDNAVGKLKVSLSVMLPLLWNPDFASSVTYKETGNAIAVFPKITVNLSSATAYVKDGFLEAQVCSEKEENDTLNLDLKKTELALKDGEVSVGGKDLVGRVTTEGGAVRITFDWSCKGLLKHVQQLARAVTFVNKTPGISEIPRIVQLTYNGPEGNLFCNVTVSIYTKDNPTQAVLGATTQAVIRRAGPVPIAPTLQLVDPARTELDAETAISITVVGGVSSDTISLPSFRIESGKILSANNDELASAIFASPFSLSITNSKLKLVDMQQILRGVSLALLANQRDRSTRKSIVFDVRSKGHSVKSTAILDVLPPLVEIPSSLPELGVTWHSLVGEVLDPFALLVVPNLHFVDVNCEISVSCIPASTEMTLLLSSSCGITFGKGGDMFWGSAKIGKMTSKPGFIAFSISKETKKGESCAPQVQRILRGLTLQVSGPFPLPMNLSLKVEEPTVKKLVLEEMIPVNVQSVG